MKTIIYLAITLLFILIIWTVLSYVATRNLEAPAYTVLEQTDRYEIRQYEPYLIAETTIDTTTYRGDLNQGFQLVADYIFGNNTTRESIAMTTPVLEATAEAEQNEKIAMTVPVLETATTTNTRTVAFVLPAAYSLANAPIPNDARVTLREVPGQKVAALRFGWYGTDSRVTAKKAELTAALAADGIVARSNPQAAFYNPPLTMPLLLRNEILIVIE